MIPLHGISEVFLLVLVIHRHVRSIEVIIEKRIAEIFMTQIDLFLVIQIDVFVKIASIHVTNVTASQHIRILVTLIGLKGENVRITALQLERISLPIAKIVVILITSMDMLHLIAQKE